MRKCPKYRRKSEILPVFLQRLGQSWRQAEDGRDGKLDLPFLLAQQEGKKDAEKMGSEL